MRHGFALLVTVLALGCAVESEPTTGQVDEPIINGTDDNGRDPAVALFLAVDSSGDWVIGCTATMITRRIALTAAHCMSNIQGASGFRLKFLDSWDFASNVETGVDDSQKTVVSQWIDPDYVPAGAVGGDVHDLALVVINDPIVSTIAPQPIYRSRVTTKILGQSDRFVGFGIRSDNPDDTLFLRQFATANITNLDGQTFGWTGQTSWTCHGDSGGPHLVTVNGVEYTIGVTSSGVVATCAGRSDQQRLDVSLAAILQFIADHDAQPTANCGADGVCGWNCPDIDPDCPCILDGRCDVACPDLDTDPDCPTSCEADGVCQRDGCPRPDPDCGTAAVGEVCTINQNCLSGLCVPSGTDHVCSQACDASGACPSGFACKASTNVCLPETGGGGGCSVGGGRSGLGLALAGLSLVVLVRLGLRRRRKPAPAQA